MNIDYFQNEKEQLTEKDYKKGLFKTTYYDEYTKKETNIKGIPLLNYESFVVCYINTNLYLYDKNLDQYNLLEENFNYNQMKYEIQGFENLFKFKDHKFILGKNIFVDLAGIDLEMGRFCLENPTRNILGFDDFCTEYKKNPDLLTEEDKRILEEELKRKEEAELRKAEQEKLRKIKEQQEELKEISIKFSELLDRMAELCNSGTKIIKQPIAKEILCEIHNEGYYEIKEMFKNKLKYIDLSGIDFEQVKVAGIDFTDCNPTMLAPQTVYKQDLSNTTFVSNLDNPDSVIPFGALTDFSNVNLNGATIISNKPLMISFAGAITDSSTQINIPGIEINNNQESIPKVK